MGAYLDEIIRDVFVQRSAEALDMLIISHTPYIVSIIRDRDILE